MLAIGNAELYLVDVMQTSRQLAGTVGLNDSNAWHLLPSFVIREHKVSLQDEATAACTQAT